MVNPEDSGDNHRSSESLPEKKVFEKKIWWSSFLCCCRSAPEETQLLWPKGSPPTMTQEIGRAFQEMMTGF